MTEEDKAILIKNNWNIDVESPEEISDEDGNRATGEAVHLIIAYYKKVEEYNPEKEKERKINLDAIYANLDYLVGFLEGINHPRTDSVANRLSIIYANIRKL